MGKSIGILLVSITVFCNSCFIITEIGLFEKKSENFLITNATSSPLRIKTFPSVNATYAEKFIRWDSNCVMDSNWKANSINCYILRHDFSHQDTGEYIMQPNSFFRFGFSYKSGRKKFRAEDLDISYLEIYLPSDTIVAKTKEEIVALAKNPRFRKQKGDKINKKYFRYDYFKIVIADRHLK